MKLIVENQFEEDLDVVQEEVAGKQQYKLRGIYMQAEVKNGNKRIYPKALLEESVSDFIEERIKTRRSVGELNHPDTGVKINLDRVSHLITDLHWDGNNVLGEAVLTDTPMGNIAKGLLDAGVKLGVSSRGLGNVSGNTVDKYILRTVDIVSEPSAPSAFVDGIMEGMEYFVEGDTIIEIAADHTRRRIKDMTSKELAERKTELFEEYIESVFSGFCQKLNKKSYK